MKKLIRTKSVIALALALLMVVPMLFAALPAQAYTDNTPVLSVVPSGSAGATSTTVVPKVAVGSSLSLDVRVDNTGSIAPGINGASYSVTWDPSVLKLDIDNNPTAVVEGSTFWGAKMSDLGFLTQDVPNGKITFGQIIADTAHPLGVAPGSAAGGVLATLTFTVLQDSESSVNLQASDVGVPYLTFPTLASGKTQNNPIDTTTVNAIYNPIKTTISLYQHGTTNPVVQYTGGQPIGSDVQVDIVMSNQRHENIFGWNLGLNWNPVVLQLVDIEEGTYMTGTPGLHDGGATMFVPGFIDNSAGTVLQGISDMYLTNTTQNAQDGVMAVLTFQIVGYADSNITLTSGIPTLVDSSLRSLTVDGLNGATYVSGPAPAPIAPQAVITSNAPIMGGFPSYIANQPITVNGSSSIAGSDPLTQPVNPAVPITGYSWTVTNNGQTLTTGTDSILAFNAPATVNGDIVVTLTVTTAATTNPAYNNTGSTTLLIKPGILSPTNDGAVLDLYIVNNGTSAQFPSTVFPYKSPTGQNEYNSTVDSYAPQQVMNLAAFVSFDSGDVADKLVSFTVADANTGALKASFTAYTNESGIAVAQYRLPNYNSGVMPFGQYNITAKVDVVQYLRSDSINFTYAYTLNLGAPTTDGQLYARGRDTPVLTVPITSTSQTSQDYYVTYTVTDINGVPIFSGESAKQVIGALGTGAVVVPLTIPSYAYAGTATVHVNIFNADPSVPTAYALPYCPEATTKFTIGMPPAQ